LQNRWTLVECGHDSHARYLLQASTDPCRRSEPGEWSRLYRRPRGALADRAKEKPLALGEVRDALERHAGHPHHARPFDRCRPAGILQGVRHDQGVAQGRVHRGQVSALDQEVPHYDLEEHGYQAERRCPGIVQWRPCQEGTGGAEDLLADPDGPTGCLAVPGSPPGLRQEGAAVLLAHRRGERQATLDFGLGILDFGFDSIRNPKSKIQNQASPAGSGEPKARDTPSGWRRFRRRHPASRRGLADTGVS